MVKMISPLLDFGAAHPCATILFDLVLLAAMPLIYTVKALPSWLRLAPPLIVVLVAGPVYFASVVFVLKHSSRIGGYNIGDSDIFFVFYCLPLLIFAFSVIYLHFGLRNVQTNSLSDSFWDSLYFSSITATTVGYGDFVPDGTVSKMFAVYQALLAYFTLAATFAFLTIASN